jgi:hypothetical protein
LLGVGEHRWPPFVDATGWWDQLKDLPTIMSRHAKRSHGSGPQLSDGITKPIVRPFQVSGLARRADTIMRADDQLSDEDRTGLKDACAPCPDPATLTDLAHGFNDLTRQRAGDRLEAWINQAAIGLPRAD